jgi:hypothetical protein
MASAVPWKGRSHNGSTPNRRFVPFWFLSEFVIVRGKKAQFSIFISSKIVTEEEGTNPLLSIEKLMRG